MTTSCEHAAVEAITGALGPLTPEERRIVLDRVMFLAFGGVRYDFTDPAGVVTTFHEAEIEVAPKATTSRGEDRD